MANDTVLMINADFGKRASVKVEGLENKVKASMRAVIKENWLVVNDDDALFRAGIGGVLLDVGMDSDDGKRLIASVNTLKQFGSFLSAASVGMECDFPDIANLDDVLPLMGWWLSIKQEGA